MISNIDNSKDIAFINSIPASKSEKILLINPKESYTLGSPPLGIGYLISYSDHIGKNSVWFHDENFINNDDLNKKLIEVLNEFNPSYVAISFPSSAVLRVVDILKFLKKGYPEIIIFAGGYHPTSDPEATLRTIPLLDFIILDHGEHSFAFISDDWKSLPSVAYINDKNEYIHNCVENPIGSLDNIPIIDRSIYDKRYFEPKLGTISGIFGKTGTLITSRGCPYRCSFCSIELLQQDVEYHSVDYVIAEIESILSTIGKIDYLYFQDVMFLTKWGRIEELCKRLIQTKLLKHIKWATTVSSNAVTYEKVKLMKEAGCFYLSFGLESNSERSLKLINKAAKPKHNQNAVDICKKLGIWANSAFLFGIPGEKEEDLNATLDFVKRNNIFSTGVNILKPLPGSPFYYEFKEKGLIKNDIETWHKISSIHHESQIFNNLISKEIYDRYINKFYALNKYRQKINHFKANIKNTIKYKFSSNKNLENFSPRFTPSK